MTTGLKWEEKDNKITLIDGENRYEAKASVNAEHPGYKLVYSSYAFLYSANANVRWKQLTKADFDGETQYEFKGTYTMEGPDGGEKTVELNLGKDNHVYLYSGSEAPTAEGTWSLTGTHLTVDLGGTVLEADPGADGKYTLNYQITVSSFFGTSTVDVVLSQTK